MATTMQNPTNPTSSTDWLSQEIARGFQRLMVLGLERQPAGELLPGTVAAWVDRLCRRGWTVEDAPRIREAFGRLSETRRAWPLIADFLEAVPQRVDQEQPSRRWAAEELEANRKRLAEMVDKLLAGEE
jgi:hypothetical protein